MAELNINNFDMNIKKILAKAIKLANKKWTNRNWHADVTYFNDTDYQLTLISCWGGKRHGVTYQKSHDEFKYIEQEMQPLGEQWCNVKNKIIK